MAIIGMNQEIADLSFWDAIGADDLVASEIMQSYLEFEDAAPFDRIQTDSSLDYLLWSKTFYQGFSSVAPFPVVRTYLGVIMPELEELNPGFSAGQVFAVWKTENPGRVIRESFESMSPVTKAILDGSTTFKEVVEDFFTPEVAAKAIALHESASRLQRREIVRILMDGESVSLAEGVL